MRTSANEVAPVSSVSSASSIKNALADMQRISDRIDGVGLRHHARRKIEIRLQEQSDDQLIVSEDQLVAIPAADQDLPSRFVYMVEPSGQDPGLRDDPSYRIDHIARLHAPADNLGQQGIEEHVRRIMHQGDMHPRIGPMSFSMRIAALMAEIPPPMMTISAALSRASGTRQ
jgi:hypothetical protein